MSSKLVIINGAPGVGKTTLAKRIAQDVSILAMGKDTIKEFLFDNLGTRDREWSRTLGVASIDMLHILSERLLLSGEMVLMENAFYKSFAEPRIKKFCTENHIPVLQVYCFTDKATNLQRFTSRTVSGERHPGHVDFDNVQQLKEMIENDNYAPLEIAETVQFDTTNYNDEDYGKLLTQIRRFLAM